ncbi:hypothetical protein NEF87_001261 [Candidatus Lokiarchaeum ossiferum]|uniref:Condensation domain-containing protein n=1 Tax=Candidatus Lokiarchaeum ossiferum TaxID=2951803 RepID=A0ABY6HNH7_9ARCH|nr:hypothetical protein NEF87_001261 [Candidatus Lokiarchaeum sp. B-35]
MEQRLLHPYESMLSGSNITLAVQIQGQLSQGNLLQALHQTALIHPYLQYEICIHQPDSQQNTAKQFFQKKKPLEFNIHSETAPVTQDSWQERIQKVSSSPQTNMNALSQIQLYSDPNNNNNDLILVFNHAGIDGLGVFHVLDILLQSLAKPSEVLGKKRVFQDIISRIPNSSGEIPYPSLPNDAHPPLMFSSNYPPNTPAQIKGVWAEFSEDETNQLRQICRKNESTIQAVITTVEMIALLKYLRQISPLPQTIIHMAPINMRPFVEPPLEREDCVCGSSAVLWSQKITSTMGLWECIQDSTVKLKQEINRKAALRWWYNMAKGEFINPSTFMASSIGNTPIKKTYGEFTVSAVKLIGGAYDKAITSQAGSMVHAYTVCNHLNITLAFTNPPISKDWGQGILDDMVFIIKNMLKISDKDLEIGQILQLLSLK